MRICQLCKCTPCLLSPRIGVIDSLASPGGFIGLLARKAAGDPQTIDLRSAKIPVAGTFQVLQEDSPEAPQAGAP